MAPIVPLLLALAPLHPEGLQTCQIDVQREGPRVTLAGVVDPKIMSEGDYILQVRVQSRGNSSVSVQSGQFDAGHSLRVATAQFLVKKGTTIAASLELRDGDRRAYCSKQLDM